MLRTSLSLSSALVLASLSALLAAPAGCASRAGEDVGSSEHMDTASDLAEAKSVLALLGGVDGRCSDCHSVTATKVRAWGNAMKEIETACLTAEGLSATDRLNCLRSTPTNPASPFSARRLGLYAAGATGESFKPVFDAAFSTESAASELAAFTQKVSMPRGGVSLTPDEFAKVKAWVLRGMPELDAAAAPIPPPSGCTPSTTPELAAHLTSMRTEGWGARLADQSTPMFGCGKAGSAVDCLTALPDATATFGAEGVTQTMRRLHKQRLASHYWVRSSADGRYVGYGMNDSAEIIDLSKPEGTGVIRVAADYDPYFLPSNDGFAFAGAHEDGGIRLCRQSLLADVGTAAAPSVSLSESKCTSVGQDVYMSIGTALDGGRYFMTFGSHENDDGGNEQTTPLPASFSANARTVFTPMVNDGLSYRAQSQVTVRLPHEGDMMLSPSNTLAATRFGDGTKQRGYRVRFIRAEQPAGAALTIQTPLAAEVCLAGSKPNFSFDERFIATHQYVDHSEPDQATLPRGSANIVIADLATGKQVRVTTSKAGQFALYPHFRADGWLYFIVRDMNDDVEYVVATDIALRLATL
jgi:hypothetical protein